MFWISGTEVKDNRLNIIFEYFNWDKDRQALEILRKYVLNLDEFMEFYNKNKSL